jgi:predicted ATPase
MLLLLDNLEHLLESASELSELLERAEGLTLLVTSREVLRIRGETSYALPPLPEDESLLLLCERARVEPSEPLRELAARLEGLPLALELAAARLSILTPKQLLERLSKRLDLLKAGRDADPRQQTLRATIEWSYDLLSPDEQRLFRALSVFSGGCTLEAAEEVCDADLDSLQSLVDKSLLRFTEERFWMLETIREYASERLEAAGEAPRVNRRHAEYVLLLASELATAYGAAPEHRRFLAEKDNFRGARDWAERSGDTRLQMDLVGRVWPFWWYRGDSAEGLRWVESALAESDSRPDSARMHVLAAGAMFAFRSGALDLMKSYAEQSLQVARALGERSGIGWPLVFLGIAATEAADFAGARRSYDEAAAAAIEAGDQALLGVVMNNLGVAATYEGDVHGAIAYSTKALEISRELGTRDETAAYTVNLADALSRAGRSREAAEVARGALVLAREAENVMAVDGALMLLAEAAREQGRPEVGPGSSGWWTFFEGASTGRCRSESFSRR